MLAVPKSPKSRSIYYIYDGIALKRSRGAVGSIYIVVVARYKTCSSIIRLANLLVYWRSCIGGGAYYVKNVALRIALVEALHIVCYL